MLVCARSGKFARDSHRPRMWRGFGPGRSHSAKTRGRLGRVVLLALRIWFVRTRRGKHVPSGTAVRRVLIHPHARIRHQRGKRKVHMLGRHPRSRLPDPHHPNWSLPMPSNRSPNRSRPEHRLPNPRTVGSGLRNRGAMRGQARLVHLQMFVLQTRHPVAVNLPAIRKRRVGPLRRTQMLFHPMRRMRKTTPIGRERNRWTPYCPVWTGCPFEKTNYVGYLGLACSKTRGKIGKISWCLVSGMHTYVHDQSSAHDPVGSPCFFYGIESSHGPLGWILTNYNACVLAEFIQKQPPRSSRRLTNRWGIARSTKRSRA